MKGEYSIWANIFGKRQIPAAGRPTPKIGDVFIHLTEFAQVISLYEEATRIKHIYFRL